MKKRIVFQDFDVNISKSKLTFCSLRSHLKCVLTLIQKKNGLIICSFPTEITTFDVCLDLL
jgi:hypothetical protein